METILIDVENKEKAEALRNILSDLNFVTKVKSVKKKSELLEALKQHEEMKKSIVKRKNKGISKYL